MAFPILPFVIGGGLGAFIGAQTDDAVETVTGERGGIPYLQLAIIGAVLIFTYKAVKAVRRG